jgi:hypothetical protein
MLTEHVAFVLIYRGGRQGDSLTRGQTGRRDVQTDVHEQGS